MQARMNKRFFTGKPERLTRMAVHNIYKVPANVLAKSSGKLTAHFKPMTLNSSSKCIPVRAWVVMYYSVSHNPHLVSILCLSRGIYHKGDRREDGLITTEWNQRENLPEWQILSQKNKRTWILTEILRTRTLERSDSSRTVRLLGNKETLKS